MYGFCFAYILHTGQLLEDCMLKKKKKKKKD